MTETVENVAAATLDVRDDVVSSSDAHAACGESASARACEVNGAEAEGRGKRAAAPLANAASLVVAAFVLAFGLRVFVLEPFHIPSASMEPTLMPGDTIGAAKYPYGWSGVSASPVPLPMISGRLFGHPPRRGDIVIFRNELDGGADYVKRVVGLPGDEVQMREGVLHINGEASRLRTLDVYDSVDPYGEPVQVSLYEETLPGGCSYRVQHYDYPDGHIEGQDDSFVFEVPDDSYFVMGDNRDASYDSRWLGRVGYVPAADVIGRAQFVFFSAENGFDLRKPATWARMRGDRTLKAVPCA